MQTDNQTDNQTNSQTTEEKLEAEVLTQAEAFCSALQRMLDSSLRELVIFSDALPRPLYDQPPVVESISAFARRSRYARVRILIRDSDPLVHRNHRLLILAQRLSSRVEIRKINPTIDTPQWEFALCDQQQLIFCDDAAQWQGVYQPNNPVRARQLLDSFEQHWPLAAQDANLRRLLI